MRIRRTASALLSLTLAIALTGCGGDGDGTGKPADASSDESSEATVKVLTKRELKAAMISLDDLGSDYKVDTEKDDGDDEDDSEFGCLSEIEDISGNKAIEPEAEAELKFEAKGDLGIPGVFTTLGSFESADEVGESLETLREAISGCTKIDTTDEDGFRIRLKVKIDDDKSGDATSQVNVTGTGTGSGDGISFPFSMRFSLIQVENNLALVGYVTVSDDVDDEADELCERAVARLVAAVAEKEQPDLEPLDLPVITLADLFGGDAGVAS